MRLQTLVHCAHQLSEEVRRLGHHARLHAEALDVLEVAGQLRGVCMNYHIDEDRQEVICACTANMDE